MATITISGTSGVYPVLTMFGYAAAMSKHEAITTGRDDLFAASYERLQAVESVVALITNFAENGAGSASPSVNSLPAKDQLEFAYDSSTIWMRRRFNENCDQLARIARAGAQALLQLKSEERLNLAAAANRLIAEIEHSKRRSLALLAS